AAAPETAPAPAPTAAPRPSEDWFADPPVETRAQRLTQPQPPPRKGRRGGLAGRLRGRDD
ncbi:MAG: hypothetical protein ACJ762_04125, partial [Solirubrobacteraceae bacterium]